MSQKQVILRHLQQRAHLTPLEAMGLYGIFRLAARVYDLRNEGFDIATDVRYDLRGRPYSRYSLAS